MQRPSQATIDRPAASHPASRPRVRLAHYLALRNPQHLVCYGTSLTSHGAWVAQLEAALAAQYGSLIRVTNSGEGKQTSRWGLAHFAERVIALEPDAVTIEFSINDALARLALPLEEARQNLTAMLDQLARALPRCQPILQVMNPAVGRPRGHTGYRPYLSDYEAVYRDVAEAYGLPLIDHGPRWRELLAEGEDRFLDYVPDGLHPNAEGCRRYVTPTILEALLGAAESHEGDRRFGA